MSAAPDGSYDGGSCEDRSDPSSWGADVIDAWDEPPVIEPAKDA